MKEISDYITSLELGTPQLYKNIALVPLMGKESKLEYIVFDEAVNSGLEVRETGSVPTLHMKNKTGKEIVIMQGEFVEGGKQNRMVATNVYMAKDFDGDVPVNCVQHHRWSGSGSGFDTSHGRATKSVNYASFAGQSAVWDEVRSLAADKGVHSASENIGDIYTEKKQDIGEYVRQFSYVPGAVGLVIFTQKNGSKDFTADIFDQSRTLQKNFRKLLESYVLEALMLGSDVNASTQEVLDFLGMLKNVSYKERKPVSLGRDFMLQGQTIVGSAIVYQDIPVYTTFGKHTQDWHVQKPIEFPELVIPHDGFPGHIRTGLRR